MRLWPLTLRGSGTALLGVAFVMIAHAIGIPDLVYVGALLLAVVGLSVASLHLVRRRDELIRAFLPGVAGVGDTVTVTVRLHTRTSLPTSPGTWRDALSHGLDGDADGVVPPVGSSLRAGAHPATLRYRVTAHRRGISTAGPLTIVVTDPFGLARLQRTVGSASELTVTPALVELTALDDLYGSAGGGRHAATAPPGQGSDDLIPRPYAPGDSMRRIHWRASAHRDGLMVRQEEQEATPEAVVVFDHGRHRYGAAAAHAPGDDPAFELAVTACVSAIARLAREGYRVAVIDVAGGELCDPVDVGDLAGVDTACLSFASIVARGEAPLDGLVHVFGGAATGPLVLVTGRLEAGDDTPLARAAHLSPLPVLLTVGTSPAVAERIADAGWHVAPIVPGDSVAAAWAGATEKGAGRVGV